MLVTANDDAVRLLATSEYVTCCPTDAWPPLNPTLEEIASGNVTVPADT
jgi:hypothetical protein